MLTCICVYVQSNVVFETNEERLNLQSMTLHGDISLTRGSNQHELPIGVYRILSNDPLKITAVFPAVAYFDAGLLKNEPPPFHIEKYLTDSLREYQPREVLDFLGVAKDIDLSPATSH